MENKEIDFVARHYRKGRFSAASGWRRLGIAPISWWKRYRVAAAIAGAVVISATAAIIYKEYGTEASQPEVIVTTAGPLNEVKVIDFENAPLPVVVEKIESVYGVRVEGMPESPEKYSISLHYDGTPTDLVSAINDILGTQMTVAEK